MMRRGPNKTLFELSLLSLAARPRLSFQMKNSAEQSKSSRSASSMEFQSAKWQAALETFNSTKATVSRFRAKYGTQDADSQQSKKPRIEVTANGRVVVPTSEEDMEFTHFRELFTLKKLVENRMKKLGLLHDDSLPDQWFIVGPDEHWTLDLTKVQFTPPKIERILNNVCSGTQTQSSVVQTPQSSRRSVSVTQRSSRHRSGKKSRKRPLSPDQSTTSASDSSSRASGPIHFQLAHCFHFNRSCIERLLALRGNHLLTLNLQGCPKLCDDDIRSAHYTCEPQSVLTAYRVSLYR